MTRTSPVAAADAFLANNRPADAISTIATAVRNGDPAALFQQALWQLIGAPIPRDLVAARAALRALAQIGHQEAQLIEVALLANGSGSLPDWTRALERLRAAAVSNRIASDQLALVHAMDIDSAGQPRQRPSAEALTGDGTIRRIRAFMTKAECVHVAASAADLLAPSVVVDPNSGRQIPHPIRTSDGAVIGPVREDLVIRAINHRIACASDSDVDAGESLAVLRYRNGQQFRLHHDALPATANQRVATMLIYLNAEFAGGETTFPDKNVLVRPSVGDAILFSNVRNDGSIDQTMRHAGCPVTGGEKWLATRWIRARPFSVWNGPELPKPQA